MIKKHLLTCLFFSLTNMLSAQTEKQLEEFTLVENRSQTKSANANRYVQIISKEDIESSSSKTITELLENTAGVDIRSRGSFGTQADVQIRGGSFEQTLILINGIKFTDPQTGHHMLNLPISLFDIDHIEILKGSAARVYGQNAYAGVINIITKKPLGKTISAGICYGQNNLQQLLIGGNYQLNNYQQRMSLQRLSSGGYKTNTDFSALQGFYESSYSIKKSSFNFMTGAQSKQMGANGFYSDRFPWQYEETKMGFGNIQFEQKNFLNLKLRAGYRQHQDMFELKRDTPSFSQNKHTSETYTADVSIGNKNILGAWNIGMDYRVEWLNSSNLGNRKRIISGFFAEQQISKYKNWSIVPGICLNNYSDYGWVNYPGIDVGYHFGIVHISAHAAKTFRVPTFTELYYTDGAKSSLGNANLKPEQAYSYELNGNVQKNQFTIKTALFLRSGIQQIDWIKDSITDPSWKANNIGILQTKGIEASLTFKPRTRWINFPISAFQIGYCYLTVEQKTHESISRYTYDYLKHQFTFNSSAILYKQLQANARIRYENRMGYLPFWLCDLKFYYQQKKYQLYAEASNLLNQKYVETGKIEMPGRWIRVGFSIQIGQ
ncbi:MAG: hypothetical protein CFE21_01895 [Bacteroidetes bacterium B1(2017)]|nr:MAG: hypothetical protein CFE21_01895 [Bacteroidetes bacterium B1(2017)]